MQERPSILSNPIQSYAWGSRTALAELMGRTATGQPEAELWIGAHPRAPSRVPQGGTLLEVIEGDAEGTLGAAVAQEFAGQLPFLLKVLAVAAPLSLQAHPTIEQARAGFEREERAGVPLGAPERNYKDSNHKPELLCALTPFEALSGFRAPSEAVELFRTLGLEASQLGRALATSGPEPLRVAFGTLMGLRGEQKDRFVGDVLERCARAAAAGAPFGDACRWAVALGKHYPGDAGAVCSLLLNYLKLEPFQAVFLEAGRLHAYLNGVGVEIMANSDNVLRGGLTPKHVDVAELARVLRFDGQRIAPTPTRSKENGEVEYSTPVREFLLSTITLGGTLDGTLDGAHAFLATTEGPELVLCTAGAVRVLCEPHAPLELARGASCFVPARLGQYGISGKGQVFRARVGRPASAFG